MKQGDFKGEIVATKHTILPEAGLDLSRDEITKILTLAYPEKLPELESFWEKGADEIHPGNFSTTKFLLNSAARANAVSPSHADWEKKVHPHSRLFPITNGINLDRWRGPNMPKEAENFDNKQLWQAKNNNREVLTRFINPQVSSKLDPTHLTIVWARRLAAYKQPDFLFSNLNTLEEMINSADRPVQFVIAGKVSTNDPHSLAVANRIKECLMDSRIRDKVAFLPHYSLSISQILVCGADVWLNTPLIGKEACGTSSMKAGLNGGLLLSTNDGWVAQEDWSDLGWLFAQDDPEEMYDLLKNHIAPLFYQKGPDDMPGQWISRQRRMINLISTKYSASRMLADYQQKLYLST